MISIKEFELIRCIGKGGFACVYQARHLKTGKEFAIKTIDKVLMNKSQMKERVQNEIIIQARLDHPSILVLHEAFEDKNFVYLVLELCRNGELRSYLKSTGKLVDKEARSFMKQIVEGVIYLHKQGIMHRDLKLANLLLDDNFNVKIADFGLATALKDPREQHYTLCGTPNYIAPEIAGRNSHGLESDVWSLGCLLYTFLVGNPPFHTEEILDTLDRVLMVDYEIPDFISGQAADLIKRLLTKDPIRRIKLSSVLHHPFMKEGDWRPTSRSISSPADSGHNTMSTDQSSATRSPFPSPFSSDRSSNSPLYTRPLRALPNHYSNMTSSEEGFQGSSKNTFSVLPKSLPSIVDDVSACHERELPGNRCSSERDKPMNKISMRDLAMIRSFENLHETKLKDESRASTSRAHSSSHREQYLSRDYCTDDVSMTSTRYKAMSDSYKAFNLKSSHLHRSQPNLQMTTGEEMLLSNSPKLCHRANSCSRSNSSIPRQTPLLNHQFTTKRLKAIRERVKNAVMSILADGCACLEITKMAGNEEFVHEVYITSADGLYVTIFKPFPTVKVGRFPPPTPSNARPVEMKTLPSKCHKKLVNLSRFIQLVKSKTPKIISYTQEAKCILMEDETSVEIRFWKDGKIVLEKKDATYIDDQGHTTKVVAGADDVTEEMKQMIKFSKAMKEKLMNQQKFNDDNWPNYPCILGSKPLSEINKNKQKSLSLPATPAYNKPISKPFHVTESFYSTPSSQKPTNQMTRKSCSLKRKNLIEDLSKVVKSSHIKGHGTVHLIKSGSVGQVWIEYEDKSQILVDGNQLFPVKYLTSYGEILRYETMKKSPEHIQHKIHNLPVLIQKVQKKK